MTSRDRFCQLSSAPFVILPSLLACDFAHLEREIRKVEEAGCQALHLDIMDGQFVPNLSFGVPVVEAIRRSTELVLDVHLMLAQPQDYFAAFRKAGADALTFHIEAVADQLAPGRNFAHEGLSVAQAEAIPALEATTRQYLRQIHELGAANGLSLNPPSEIDTLAPWLDACDNVLVMGVMPGFGGQKFYPNSLEKLRWLREHAPETLLRSVDGGVNSSTVCDCKNAGAVGLIMGTAIYDGHDASATFRKTTALLSELA